MWGKCAADNLAVNIVQYGSASVRVLSVHIHPMYRDQPEIGFDVALIQPEKHDRVDPRLLLPRLDASDMLLQNATSVAVEDYGCGFTSMDQFNIETLAYRPSTKSPGVPEEILGEQML